MNKDGYVFYVTINANQMRMTDNLKEADHLSP